VTLPAAGPDRGYILHSYPYRETSLLLQLWTERHGRFAAVAKGARRPRSAGRGVLVPFQPLSLAWFGRGEVKTLKAAEPAGAALPLAGASLLSAFYLNELLLKLIHRDDPHEGLWCAYDEAVTALRALSRRAVGVPGLLAAEPGLGEPRALEPVLRRFELAMMRELGFADARVFDFPDAAVRACVEPMLEEEGATRSVVRVARAKLLLARRAPHGDAETESDARFAAFVEGVEEMGLVRLR